MGISTQKNLAPLCAILAFFLLGAAPPGEAQGVEKKKRQVAVLMFQDTSEESHEYSFLGEHFPTIVENRLLKEPQIQIQERRNLDKVLSELELAQSGLFEPSHDLEIAKMFQADYLIIGSYRITSRAAPLEVAFRLVAAASGEVVFQADLSSPDQLSLFKNLEAAAGMAAAEILGQRSAFLYLDSDPPGSEVYVDGNYIGNSPIVKYPLTAGPHEVMTMAKNYVSDMRSIDIQEGQEVRQKVNLFFKGFSYYNLKFYLLKNVHTGKLGRSGEAPVYEDMTGVQLGAFYAKNRYLLGLSLDSHRYYREHQLTIFTSSYTEKRLYFDNNWNVSMGYYFPIYPAYLVVTPSLSLGYRTIRDSLQTDEALLHNTPPYDIETFIAQPGFHINLDIFPGFVFGLMAQFSFYPTAGIPSFNGSFNPLGEKGHDSVNVNASKYQFMLGARVAM